VQRADGLSHAIARVQGDCEDILGAVLATPEGLVLAARGTLEGDVPAAAATHLADVLDHNLSLLLSTSCSEALVWTPAGVWGIARLPSRHVVLAHAASSCAANTLRLALGRFRRDLGPALQELAPPEVGATP
jgi:hypothetical protein